MIIKNRKEVGVTCGLGRASLAEIFGSGFGPFQKWEIHKLGPENCVGSFFYAWLKKMYIFILILFLF